MRKLGLTLLLAAASGGASADGPFRISITSPGAEQAAFGDVEFAVEVDANEPVDRVEFFLDSTLQDRDDTPPYRVRVDAGERNVEKRFTAVAYGVSGRTATATRVTPRVAVDLEVELSLQQLYVTVTRGTEAVYDLDRKAFRVFDSGIEQQLVTFERGEAPMTVVVLVDASDSMQGEQLGDALGAARRFLESLRPLDEAMVLVFSDRSLYVTRFNRGITRFEPPADLVAAGGTALNDHLYAALSLLDSRLGRPVVLLLSDGADTLSFLRIGEVLWKTRRSDAVIYRVRPTSNQAEPTAFATSWRGFQENRDEIEGLEQAIRESGGRVHLCPSERLEETLESVMEELRQQYVLGYYPSTRSRDGTWRPILVEVAVPGVEVRTRSGYVDR